MFGKKRIGEPCLRVTDYGAPYVRNPEAVVRSCARMLCRLPEGTPLRSFWENAYRRAVEEVNIRSVMKEVRMGLWKNGRKPRFIESDKKEALTAERIPHAVAAMSYEGLQFAAAGFFTLAQRLGLSPAEAVWLIDGSDKNKRGNVTALTVSPAKESPDGNDAA